jgi:tRNA G37 N-methylase TrmD
VKNVKFAVDKSMIIMNVVEKRDFIHSHLHQVDESLINQFYDMLRKEEVLKAKLISRAEKSEYDIHAGKVFSRAEIEQRIKGIL